MSFLNAWEFQYCTSVLFVRFVYTSPINSGFHTCSSNQIEISETLFLKENLLWVTIFVDAIMYEAKIKKNPLNKLLNPFSGKKKI